MLNFVREISWLNLRSFPENMLKAAAARVIMEDWRKRSALAQPSDGYMQKKHDVGYVAAEPGYKKADDAFWFDVLKSLLVDLSSKSVLRWLTLLAGAVAGRIGCRRGENRPNYAVARGLLRHILF